jgi:pyruvate dehydrogenase E2 component (dihydrolipoamide acetyltransferase)
LLLILEVADAAEVSAPAAPAKPAAAAVQPAPAAAPVKAATPAPAQSGGTIEMKVPDIGDFKEVEVIELLVKVGDTIKVDQLITVESDKASMEIPSSHAGVVKALQVKLGDKIAKVRHC